MASVEDLRYSLHPLEIFAQKGLADGSIHSSDHALCPSVQNLGVLRHGLPLHPGRVHKAGHTRGGEAD